MAVVAVAVCLRGKVHATCRCGAGELELVFVMDATASMQPVIGTVKAQAERMIEILEGQVESLRVGAVAYRTRKDREMPVPVFHDLTGDRKELAGWLRRLRTGAGGEEAVDDALAAAVNEMSWTEGSRKVVVLIGDEGPPEERESRLLKIVGEAASRGIVVHTITPSKTAWTYFFNRLRNERPDAAAELFAQYGGSRENLERTFRLPIMEATARVAGGRATGSADTREIVKWLIAFALGSEEAEEYPEVRPAREEEILPPEHEAAPDLPRGRTRIGRVVYGGEWETPRAFDGLVGHLRRAVRIDLDLEPEVVRLSERGLWRHPLLYLSGHGPVRLTDAERAGLKAYVEAGGLLWADNCCGRAVFEETLREELARVWPASRLERLAPSHPVFEIGHVIERVRYTSGHRGLPYVPGPPHVEAIVVDGREAVLYTPHSLGAGWKMYDYGKPCLVHDDDGLRLSENIVLFAFSR
jgi:hypothetical protein